MDTTGEYHEVIVPYHATAAEVALLHRPYGMGPRVPMYILSPWSRGGWVDSQVFDHTSIIRFIEARFGVMEPNISAWRRAVSGDLTSAFNFADPNDSAFFEALPSTLALANRSRALPGRTTPVLPSVTTLPVQTDGVRPVSCDTVANELVVSFTNSGGAPCVFTLTPNQYDAGSAQYTVVARSENVVRLPLRSSGGWYDFSVSVKGQTDYSRRFAGRLETGLPSFSDPAMFGPAIGDQLKIG